MIPRARRAAKARARARTKARARASGAAGGARESGARAETMNGTSKTDSRARVYSIVL